MSETEITGALAYLPADFDAVIAAMAAGKYSIDGWVEVIGLEGVVDALTNLRAGRGMKVLVESV